MVPGPEMAPERLIFPEISPESVAPEWMKMGVLSVTTVELVIPLDSSRVPEFMVVVPVYVVATFKVTTPVPTSVRPEDPASVQLIDALSLAVIKPEVLMMVPPVSVKFPLAAGLKTRDCTVCVPVTVTVPGTPVPGLPPKMAVAPDLHSRSVIPLLKVQVWLVVFQVPLPLSIRLLPVVLSQVKADADPFRAQKVFCSFCAMAGKQQSITGNI